MTPRSLRPRDGRLELFGFSDSRGSRRCEGGKRYEEDNVAFKQSEESSMRGRLLSTSPVSCACLRVIISPAEVSVEAVYYMGHQPCINGCEVCVCVCVCVCRESFIWTSQKLYEKTVETAVFLLSLTNTKLSSTTSADGTSFRPIGLPARVLIEVHHQSGFLN